MNWNIVLVVYDYYYTDYVTTTTSCFVAKKKE